MKHVCVLVLGTTATLALMTAQGSAQGYGQDYGASSWSAPAKPAAAAPATSTSSQSGYSQNWSSGKKPAAETSAAAKPEWKKPTAEASAAAKPEWKKPTAEASTAGNPAWKKPTTANGAVKKEVAAAGPPVQENVGPLRRLWHRLTSASSNPGPNSRDLSDVFRSGDGGGGSY